MHLSWLDSAISPSSSAPVLHPVNAMFCRQRSCCQIVLARKFFYFGRSSHASMTMLLSAALSWRWLCSSFVWRLRSSFSCPYSSTDNQTEHGMPESAFYGDMVSPMYSKAMLHTARGTLRPFAKRNFLSFCRFAVILSKTNRFSLIYSSV